MPAEYTPNFNLIKPDPDDFYDVTEFNDNMDKLDASAVKRGAGVSQLIGGTLAARPEPGIAGRYYFAQDKGEIWLDTGTEWVLAAASNAELVAHLAETAQDEGGVHGLEISEGTWTPVVKGGVTAGNHTYATRWGYYYKIGKLVFATFQIDLSAKDATMDGYIKIDGLPFVVSSMGGGGSISRIYQVTLDPGFTQLALIAYGGTSSYGLIMFGGEAWETVFSSQIGENFSIIGSVSYFA